MTVPWEGTQFQAEYERLQNKIDMLNKMLDDAERTATADHRAMLAAVQVLRDVEFGDHTDFGDYCPHPTCDAKKPGEHGPGCKLNAVITGEPRCFVCGGLPLPGCDGKHLCPAPP